MPGALEEPHAETTKAKSSGVYFGSEMEKFQDLALGSKTDKRRKAQYTEALRLQVELRIGVGMPTADLSPGFDLSSASQCLVRPCMSAG